MPEHLEIEQKFEVDEGFARPDFGSLDGVSAAPPVVHQLSATYYDTPGQRLAGSKVTLRRRTGGSDAGWHLKLPADGGRREIHLPLAASEQEVPDELARWVAEVTRGEALAPIARLDTERTVVTLRHPDGAVAAEVADDAVTARRLPAGGPRAGAVLRWREVEVEVPEPAPGLQAAAAALLLAAGARPAGHGSKLARLLDRVPAADR